MKLIRFLGDPRSGESDGERDVTNPQPIFLNPEEISHFKGDRIEFTNIRTNWWHGTVVFMKNGKKLLLSISPEDLFAVLDGRIPEAAANSVQTITIDGDVENLHVVQEQGAA